MYYFTNITYTIRRQILTHFYKSLLGGKMKRWVSYTRIVFWVLIVAFIYLSGCASMIKKLREVHRANVYEAPHYESFQNSLRLNDRPIAHVSLRPDRRITQEQAEILQPFLDELNRAIDAQGWTIGLGSISAQVDDAPDIYVGDIEGFNSPLAGTYDKRSSKNLYIDRPPLVIYAVDPNQNWKERLIQSMNEQNVDFVIFVTFGISEYFINQGEAFGSKIIELGTGHNVDIPWIAALNQPAQVLHLSGALLDNTGKVVRAGSEGLIVKENIDLESTAMQIPLISEDIESLLFDARREELQGNPLVWQVALQNLFAQLMKRNDLIIE